MKFADRILKREKPNCKPAKMRKLNLKSIKKSTLTIAKQRKKKAKFSFPYMANNNKEVKFFSLLRFRVS